MFKRNFYVLLSFVLTLAVFSTLDSLAADSKKSKVDLQKSKAEKEAAEEKEIENRRAAEAAVDDKKAAIWKKCKINDPDNPTKSEENCYNREALKFADSIDNSEDKCESSYSNANRVCGATQFSEAGMGALNQFAMARQSGDIKGACKSAKQVSLLAMAVNGGLATACETSRRRCVSACQEMNIRYSSEAYRDPQKANRAVSYRASCESKGERVLSAMMQTVQSATAFTQSQQCEKLADALAGITPIPLPTPDMCMTANAYNTPQCLAQYCSVPGRQNDPNCSGSKIADLCSNVAYASTDLCKQNNLNPNGPGSSRNTAGTNRNGTSVGREFGDIAEDDLPPPPKDVQAKSSPLGESGGFQSGGGGGLGAGSGSAGALGPSGANTGGGGEKNPEIYLATGAAGNPDAALGTNDDGSGGGEFHGSGIRDSEGHFKGLDLRKFLPGGDKADGRSPASVDNALLQAGISEANGLSNWEKVTRKMQEKKPELKQ